MPGIERHPQDQHAIRRSSLAAGSTAIVHSVASGPNSACTLGRSTWWGVARPSPGVGFVADVHRIGDVFQPAQSSSVSHQRRLASKRQSGGCSRAAARPTYPASVTGCIVLLNRQPQRSPTTVPRWAAFRATRITHLVDERPFVIEDRAASADSDGRTRPDQLSRRAAPILPQDAPRPTAEPAAVHV
jgi:hypothetical protein